jgi:hypothetical protein
MQTTKISEIRRLWSYLCKPVGESKIERPPIPRIKSGNYFWYVKLATKWVRLWYWLKHVYTPGYILEVMLLSQWRFDPIAGHGLPSLGFTNTLMNTPRSVGLLWTSDQPDAETYTRQHNTLTTDSHPSPSAGFEPANPASERLQTHVLDHAATGIGRSNVTNVKYIWILCSVNCKVCYVSVRILRDNDFYKNYLFYFISLFYSSNSQIQTLQCNISCRILQNNLSTNNNMSGTYYSLLSYNYYLLDFNNISNSYIV